MTSPAAVTRNGATLSALTDLTVLVTFRPGAWLRGTSADAVSGPVSLESAVTVLSMSPSPPPLLSMSAWVTVYVPVQLRLAPAARVKPVGTNGAPGTPAQSSLPRSGSSMDTPVRVTLPVLVTTMEYVIT